MKLTMKRSAVAMAAMLAAAPVSAAVLDFTDNSVGTLVDSSTFTGTIGSVGYTLTSDPSGLNRSQAFDGPSLAGISPLVGDNDGFGIKDDEATTNGVFQTLTIVFDRTVTITTAYFLDVFANNDGETARMLIGAAPADSSTFDAEAPGVHGNGGFTTVSGSFIGTTFSFFAGPGQDDATADVALAALEIEAVPLPAGMLLLGTALGGLGIARRRAKSA